jgi:xylene monooxygenase electron transfer component
VFGLFKKTEAATCRISVAASGRDFEVRRGGLLLMSALEQGLAYPHSCKVGTCGSCKTRLLEGKIKPLIDFALSPLTAEELKGGYILACQSKVLTDLSIEVAIGDVETHPISGFSGIVSSVRRLPGDVVDLRVSLKEPIRFKAGQFADLTLEAAPAVTRSYSFYDLPSDTGNREVGFLIKRLHAGAFSEILWSRSKPGDAVALTGPFGTMGNGNPDLNAICVAGGTGLAPILSIVKDRVKRSAHSRTVVLFGVRAAKDDFAAEMRDVLVAEGRGRVSFETILSDEPEGSAWPGPRGLVTELIGRELVEDVTEVMGFACGASAMVSAVDSKLQEIGIPADRIHTDRFLASGENFQPASNAVLV